MEERISTIIGHLTLEEKASLLTGRDFWSTAGIDRLGVPSLSLSDGPHGLRKTSSTSDMGTDVIPSVCFPTEAALASSWDAALVREIGEAIADQCLELGVDMVLGPGVNMKRTPLGGRNFEHFSEDPVLSGELGAAFVLGVQSKGIGACVKHFACNNQEYERMTISAEVDERTLRETYLSAFERVVRKAKPWMVMAAYNRVNGLYAAEHRQLLTDILKREWAFEGAVVSDWGGVSDIVRSVAAGLDLEMPGNRGYSARQIVEAVKTGRLAEEAVNDSARRLLKLAFRARAQDKLRPQAALNEEDQHALARRAAADSVVLLKNEDGLLPLKREELGALAVIGGFAREPRFQGIGSSQGRPTRLDNAFDALAQALPGTALHYAEGYGAEDEPDEQRIREAARIAASSDAAVVFAGVTPAYQAEGRDRKRIGLPEAHDRLIAEVCRAQPNTVVVLAAGSAVTMPWIDRPRAVVFAGLAGQAGGGAVADVLLGDVNPSGKLAETFPVRLEDTPAFLNYPGEAGRVRYGEGVYVGYKYYDKAQVKPLFPFGFGLSYTRFEYEAIRVDRDRLTESDTFEAVITIRNAGDREGKEIVQLYAQPLHAEGGAARPVRELKAFAKMSLKPGERREVALTIEGGDFAFYDAESGCWRVPDGAYELQAGGSSDRLPLRMTVRVSPGREYRPPLHPESPFKAYMGHPAARSHLLRALAQVPQLRALGGGGRAEEAAMLYFRDIPLRRLVHMGVLSEEAFEELIVLVKRADESTREGIR